jgi:ubiquinone/menaquinone biosynthesis C-methylase UbiE
VVSLDIDPRVRFGLSEMGAIHVVGDAGSLPYGNDTFSGIATEVPFSETALQTVLDALQEMARVLAAGGRMAVMVAEPQREPVEHQARMLDLACEACLPVNRKGLGVYIFLWRKRTQGQ